MRNWLQFEQFSCCVAAAWFCFFGVFFFQDGRYCFSNFFPVSSNERLPTRRSFQVVRTVKLLLSHSVPSVRKTGSPLERVKGFP